MSEKNKQKPGYILGTLNLVLKIEHFDLENEV